MGNRNLTGTGQQGGQKAPGQHRENPTGVRSPGQGGMKSPQTNDTSGRTKVKDTNDRSHNRNSDRNNDRNTESTTRRR